MARSYTDSQDVDSGLPRQAGNQKKKYDQKINGKHIWESYIWIDLFKWTTDMKILVPQVNVHQKVTSVV